MENTKKESGKCQTIIQVDGETIFVSDDYTWTHPDIRRNKFQVNVGSDNWRAKGGIRNIQIRCYE